MRQLTLARAGLCTVAALTLSGLLGATPAPDDLDEFVTSQMAMRHINGLSLAIEQNGKIITARAYGVTDHGEPRRVDTTTLFQAGSISKSVAALGALRLVEQGKLKLDSDINGSLASWHLPTSAFTSAKPVTLRAILSHNAGLTVHGFPGYDVDSPMPSLVQVLDGTQPANTPAIRNYIAPGVEWKYSGGGYTVMQQAMIDVTGQPFPQYMKAAVLGPLGMGRSSYEQPLPSVLAANTAAGHYSDGIKVHGRSHVYPEMAAAGLWTTPSDLLRFAMAIQDAYAGKPGAPISQATAKEMLTDQKDSDGLGVFLTKQGDAIAFNHGGRDEGFDAQLTAVASTGQGYAMMINANDNSRFSTRLGAFIARKYGWPGATSGYIPPAAIAIAEKDLTSVSGLYDVGEGGFITLVPRNGHLFTSVDGALDEEIVPIGGDKFAFTERPVQFHFDRALDGRVVAASGLRGRVSSVLQRLGPLFRDAHDDTGFAPVAIARGDSVIRAMSVGGAALQTSTALLPSARADFGATQWAPVIGATAISFTGFSPVIAAGVVRHGGTVANVGYYRVTTPAGERRIVVYFTADNLVTDVDVIDA
jgi:CubicO group peptidase (beta-lactamase class C family)